MFNLQRPTSTNLLFSMPVADGVTAFPVFQVRVNDTNPVWIHCEQTVPKSHCGAGMHFVPNV
jgi:hypothetical protein